MLWVKIFPFGCLVSSIELVPSTTKLSTNDVAMVGGVSNSMPGEISLVYNGEIYLRRDLVLKGNYFEMQNIVSIFVVVP